MLLLDLGSSLGVRDPLEVGLGLLLSCFLSLKEMSVLVLMKDLISSMVKLTNFFSTLSLMVIAFFLVAYSSYFVS